MLLLPHHTHHHALDYIKIQRVVDQRHDDHVYFSKCDEIYLICLIFMFQTFIQPDVHLFKESLSCA